MSEDDQNRHRADHDEIVPGEPLAFETEDDDRAFIEAPAMDELRAPIPTYDAEEPVILDRPNAAAFQARSASPLDPLENEPPKPVLEIDSAISAQQSRDGVTMSLLGAFLAALAIPVLIGTAFAEERPAMIVNVVSGVVLLAIGVILFLRGRYVRRR